MGVNRILKKDWKINSLQLLRIKALKLEINSQKEEKERVMVLVIKRVTGVRIVKEVWRINYLLLPTIRFMDRALNRAIKIK
jgi:hypothetical protein